MTDFRTLPLTLAPAGGPFDDPALLLSPSNWELSVLFDCGTLHELKTRDLQRVRWLFLTHLHIDHLIGFDHLLRVRLFSNLPLTIYGPPGTLATIAHRLQGYAWNLTSGSPFLVRVFELSPDGSARGEFHCHHRFRSDPVPGEALSEAPGTDGSVLLGPGVRVSSHPVQHGVPCLAFRFERSTPPKFSLETAQSLGLTPGPWVGQLIGGQAVTQTVHGVQREREWLSEKLLSPPVQHRVGYLTDTRLDQTLSQALATFFESTDVLCCETAYLEEEADLARQNLHMTTRQAALLAQRAGVGELRIFHLSRRHCERGSERHLAEVRQVHPQSHLLWPGVNRAASGTLS